jgi:multidrug resistance efflux pump
MTQNWFRKVWSLTERDVQLIRKGVIEMAMIKIDETEYDLDLLSAQAKEQLANLQFVDSELQRLKAKAAVLQTARVVYAGALKNALPSTVDMSELVLGKVK